MELTVLALGAALGLLHIALAAAASTLHRGVQHNAGPRDAPQPPLPGVAGRLDRARGNFMETFPILAALVLIAAVRDVSDWRTVWGAWLWLAARVVYLPLYAGGVFLWRSAIWLVALVGMLLILWAALLP